MVKHREMSRTQRAAKITRVASPAQVTQFYVESAVTPSKLSENLTRSHPGTGDATLCGKGCYAPRVQQKSHV